MHQRVARTCRRREDAGIGIALRGQVEATVCTDGVGGGTNMVSGVLRHAARTVTHPHTDGRVLDLEAALRQAIAGEVRFDRGSRALYATDLSIYRQVAVGVVISRT